MKKNVLTSVMVSLLIFNGCDKQKLNNSDNVSCLRDHLNLLVGGSIGPNLITFPSNDNNPYDQWGESLYYGFLKVLHEEPKSYTNSSDFIDNLKEVVPEDYLKIDPTGVNLKNVEIIFSEFLHLFIKRNIFEAVGISIKMEELVYQNEYLPEVDKIYLLKMTSTLRYFTFLGHSCTKIGDGSYEECWIGKLQEVDDSGFFAKLVCIANWPVCFGAIAADCLVEEIFN